MSTLNIKQLPNIPASKIINFENNVKNVIDAFTTNCITKIPQNIDLELNNGTLTLKAGSKIYVPNEFESDNTTPHFDEVIIENDLVLDIGFPEYSNAPHMVVVSYDVSHSYGYKIPEDIYSGASAPTLTRQYGVWYDTSSNTIKRTIDYGTTWISTLYSLPICIGVNTGGNCERIDKVFNGFGYIGSSVFVLPGIEALFSNGKNEDGSYNNIIATTERVIVNTSLTSDTNTACLLKLTNVSNEWVVSDIIQQTSSYSYDSFNNIWTNSGNEVKCCFAVSIETDSNSKVSSFNSKTVLSICDNNNIQIVSDLPDNPIEGVLYLIPEI